MAPPGELWAAGSRPCRASFPQRASACRARLVRRAEAWRDSGGTIELRSSALQWGPVRANAAATLALDEQLQPMGAGTLRLVGAEQALDALTTAGVVPRRGRHGATVLPLLSRPSAETGQPEIEVPLTLEDRTLGLARIPVLRFAPLDWPAATAVR